MGENKEYSTKQQNAATSEKFDKHEMTVPQFRDYLKEKYGTTLTGREFDLNYVHTILRYGHLPRHYGGNYLRVRKVRGVTSVTIKDEKKQFYQREENLLIDGETKTVLDRNGNIKK